MPSSGKLVQGVGVKKKIYFFTNNFITFESFPQSFDGCVAFHGLDSQKHLKS